MRASIACFVLMVSPFCFAMAASQEIKDKNNFESDYVACLNVALKNDCWSSVFGGHLDPWYAKNEEAVLKGSSGFWKGWLNNRGIFSVHKLDSAVRGGVIDARSYLVEREDGALAGLIVGFRSIRGKWYVYDVQTSASEPFLRKIIGITSLSPSSPE